MFVKKFLMFVLLPVAFGAPVKADECSDYRAAFVLYEAAKRASTEHIDSGEPKYVEAEFRAYHALGDAARAVRRTIDSDHEAARVAIHAIVSARDNIELARYLTIRVPRSPASRAAFLSRGSTLGIAHSKLSEAFREVKAAYHEALHFICFERDFEREP